MGDEGQPIGFYSMPIGAAVTVLAGNIPTYADGTPKATRMLVQAVGTNANIRMDGIAPTVATTGGYTLFNATGNFPGTWFAGMGCLQNFQAIATTGTGSLQILFYSSK